jgi:hypothetical protein
VSWRFHADALRWHGMTLGVVFLRHCIGVQSGHPISKVMMR